MREEGGGRREEGGGRRGEGGGRGEGGESNMYRVTLSLLILLCRSLYVSIIMTASTILIIHNHGSFLIPFFFSSDLNTEP